MRLKNVKGANEIIVKGKYYVADPYMYKGSWNKYFNNDNPIYIEIGMGKGTFIIENAKRYKNINFIGIEKYDSVIVRAIQKSDELELNNLKIVRIDARKLEEVFLNEVDLIYLNFSDPWPKDRHSKRRLTSSTFLNRYNSILAPEGHIEFKTDNRDLFDFSVEEINNHPLWKLDAVTYDLHNDSSMNEGNIMTEYEEKFSSLGNPIFKLIASR